MSYADALIDGPAWDGTPGSIPGDGRWYVRLALLPSEVSALRSADVPALESVRARIVDACTGDGAESTGGTLGTMLCAGPSLPAEPMPDPMEDPRYCLLVSVSATALASLASGSATRVGSMSELWRLLIMDAGYPDPAA